MLDKYTGQNHCCNEEVQKVNFRGQGECIGQFRSVYPFLWAGWLCLLGHEDGSCPVRATDLHLALCTARGATHLQASGGGKEMLGWFSCIVGPFYFSLYIYYRTISKLYKNYKN